MMMNLDASLSTSRIVPPEAFQQQPATAPSPAGVGTPLWWLYRLLARLEREKPRLVLLDDYYRGNHPFPYIRDPEVRAEYLALLRSSRSNFVRMVIRAMEQRLRIDGLRLRTERDDRPDSQTWDIWMANNLDSWSQTAFQVALTQRRAYWSVWYPERGSDVPLIAVEDPTQVYVEHQPGNRTRRAAAVKTWTDDWTGEHLANVYLPDGVWKFRLEQPTKVRPYTAWIEREPAVRNPLGVVPIIPMTHQPGLTTMPDGESEIDDLLPIQDRINTTLLNRQVAEHLAAFRQKWATGLEIPVDEHGQPVQTFKAAIDQLWVNEDPQGRYGSFEATDLDNYVKASEQDVQHICVLSFSPRHYFTVQGQAPSGDALKSAEAGLVAKVCRAQRWWNGSVRETLRLARRTVNLDTPYDAEIVWADPEYQTLGQLVDAMMKLLAGNVVTPGYVLERIGVPPSTIARLEAERLQAQLLTDAQTTQPSAPEL